MNDSSKKFSKSSHLTKWWCYALAISSENLASHCIFRYIQIGSVDIGSRRIELNVDFWRVFERNQLLTQRFPKKVSE